MVGSKEHRMCESLVAKGMLERLPVDIGCAVPSQQFVVNTDAKPEE